MTTHPITRVQDWFEIPRPREKIARLPEILAIATAATTPNSPEFVGRDVRVVGPADLPPKLGLSSSDGQARLLHDLANIELQAMELAVRTLCEYPEAAPEFRRELADLALSECGHLELCLDHLEGLNSYWGKWNVHLSLWNLVNPEDSLIDRILIVHRYLEGSGLDAGESILRRLCGVASKSVREAVSLIVNEEIDHVRFGSVWYRKFCEQENLDPEREFAPRMQRIVRLAPRKEKISRELRIKAGFSEAELDVLERLRTLPQA